MASVYKSMGKPVTMGASDFEESDLSGTDESSSTLQAEPSPAAARPAKASLPLELKNRVLMLTTRGISHR